MIWNVKCSSTLIIGIWNTSQMREDMLPFDSELEGWQSGGSNDDEKEGISQVTTSRVTGKPTIGNQQITWDSGISGITNRDTPSAIADKTQPPVTVHPGPYKALFSDQIRASRSSIQDCYSFWRRRKHACWPSIAIIFIPLNTLKKKKEIHYNWTTLCLVQKCLILS